MPDTQELTGRSVNERRPRRIAVLSEPGRNGAAALARATALAVKSSCELTIVATAPQTATHCRSCGGVSPRAYNEAVCDEVARGLREAAARLELDPHGTSVKLLIEGTDPPLTDWITQGGYDLVLLPARRHGLHFRGHPAAEPLRRIAGADIDIVAARNGRRAPGIKHVPEGGATHARPGNRRSS